MSPDALQTILESGAFALLFCAISLGSPLLAWALARLTGGRGRAAAGVGAAAAISLCAWMILRAGAALAPALRGGPLLWLGLLGNPTSGWLPVDALRAAALLHGLGFPFLGLLGGFLAQRSHRRLAPVPAAGLLAIAALCAAGVGIASSSGPFSSHLRGPDLPDLAGMAPALLVALAVAVLAKPEPVGEPPAEAARAAPDPVGAWRAMGAIPADAAPLLARPAAQTGTKSAFDGLWGWAGGAGVAPAALGAVSLDEGAHGWWVPDLPEPSERLLVTALGLIAAGPAASRILVVTDAADAAREALDQALLRAGLGGAGLLVAGADALSTALAQGRPPLAVFLDGDALRTSALHTLTDSRTGGRRWASSVGLVVVAGLDRGLQLAVTHRLFSLKRLGLALRGAGARWSALATGLGGGRGLLEAAFPGLAVVDLPLGGAEVPSVEVWRVSPRFVGGAGGPWVRRALEGLSRAGVPVSVGDPEGAFERRSVGTADAPLRLVRGLALSGAASASALDAAWLVAAWRALDHRVAERDHPAHAALWRVVDRPVTRFLLRDHNLAGLQRSGQLPAPRPLVGAANPALARGHLAAALLEGRPDRPALNALFGRALVEQLAGSDEKAHALRADPQGCLSRVALVAVPPGENRPPLRPTVTERVVRVVCGPALLAEVDALVAPTRFPPHRVFAVGERRYQVPLHSLDARRDEIRVDPVGLDAPLSQALLDLRVSRAVQVEATQELRAGPLRVQLATVEATIHERVTGVRLPDGATVRYDPVEAQYRGRVRTLLFPGATPGPALFHLARTVDDVLLAWLFTSGEDVDVIPLPPGLFADAPAGLGIVDRSVQGLGVAEAIDAAAAAEILRWARAVLGGCRCTDGCAVCTPPEVLAAGPDKAGALQILSSNRPGS